MKTMASVTITSLFILLVTILVAVVGCRKNRPPTSPFGEEPCGYRTFVKDSTGAVVDTVWVGRRCGWDEGCIEGCLDDEAD